MRVIGVLDLRGGAVVHAAGGRRERYRPLESALVAGHDPLAVARALRERAGAGELYVADLDALAGAPPDLATLRALCALAPTLVDAGATTPARAAALAAAGAASVVAATESLPAGALAALADAAPRASLTLSLDLRAGRLLAADPALHGRPVDAALRLLRTPGVTQAIVLDLARVGSAAGPPLAAVEAVVRLAPDLPVLAGGGVRGPDDLRRLAEAGAAGALVATALHRGGLTGEMPPAARRPARRRRSR